VDDSIIQTYPLCQCKAETTIHRFWDCNHAQCAWEYTQGTMHGLAHGNKPSRLVASMQWKQCIFVA
jgi:hypothetical protein